MKKLIVIAVALVLIAVGVYVGLRQSRSGAPARVNVVAHDVGGGIEELSGVYGPGFLGRRLIDGLLDPTWKPSSTASWEFVPYPQEAVFSFFERQPALVEAVVIVLPETAALAPEDVEVWTSMDRSPESFTKVAEQTLAAQPGEQNVPFHAIEARFLKLRILSGAVREGQQDTGPREGLEIAEVRVLEASRRGYVPLFTRAPRVKFWKGSPREAAQRGLEWLQQAAPAWSKQNNCFGCHVQSQVLMGQAVALKQGYRVSMPAMRALADFTRSQSSYGTWLADSHSATVFGAMGLAYAAEASAASSDQELLMAADSLVQRQAADGALPMDRPTAPIVQGQFMTTANAIIALTWAAAHASDPKYKLAAERAVAWIASHEPETTQDKIFKVIALMRDGTSDQKRLAWSVVEELSAEQQPDGGWKEVAAMNGSNAFATGQVLYAFKQAGVSIHGEMFRRGADFLLQSQVNDPTPDNGMWQAVYTQNTDNPSGFAHTMWAVIGLAGSYGADPTGALQIVKQQGDKPPTRNLEIVLDVSGSMNTKLGSSTRWTTALDVLKQTVDALPEDLNVGLRVYGHRYSSKSAQTCSDTELVVPLEKLDRNRIMSTATKLRPRGETPLVHSVLQTIGDLRATGGGSVILVTDGEESCKGDPKAAAAELQASGLNVTLNIVGFTLSGETAEAELGALAGSTGGRYYGAQDGTQLSRAVMRAALQRLPYDVLDSSGNVLVSGQTSELSHELPPGTYRLRIHALDQVLEEPVTIVADQTAILALAVEGDQFVIRR